MACFGTPPEKRRFRRPSKSVAYAPNFVGTCLCRTSVPSNTCVYGWTLVLLGKGRDAPIHIKTGTGDKGGFLRRQEQNGVSDLSRRTWAL